MIDIKQIMISDEDARDVLSCAGIKPLGGVYVVGRFCVRDGIKHRESLASRDALDILNWIFEVIEDKSTGEQYRSNVVIVHGVISVNVQDIKDALLYQLRVNQQRLPGVM